MFIKLLQKFYKKRRRHPAAEAPSRWKTHSEYQQELWDTFEIAVLSEAEAATHVPPIHDVVLIRIADPNRDLPAVTGKYEDILNLRFFDMETSYGADGTEETPCYKQIAAAAPVAEEFIRKHIEKGFVIHCHAGVSRSAAMAILAARIKGFAAAERLLRDRKTSWNPNYWVLRALLSNLG